MPESFTTPPSPPRNAEVTQDAHLDTRITPPDTGLWSAAEARGNRLNSSFSVVRERNPDMDPGSGARDFSIEAEMPNPNDRIPNVLCTRLRCLTTTTRRAVWGPRDHRRGIPLGA